MKISRSLALLFLLRFSLFAQTVPPLVNYQGRLSNPDGSPLATTNYQISFSIYDAASAGNLIWGPEIFDGATAAGHGAMIPVVQGYFNALLGPSDIMGDPLAGAFNATNRFVEITVGTNPPIAPRQQILTTPFAFVAATAGLAGNVASGINITNASISGNGGGLTNLNALQLSPSAALLSASQNFTGQNNFSPNVGIGTTTPLAPLHVFSAGFPTELVDGSSAFGTWLDVRNTASGTNWHIISTGSANGEGPGKLLFGPGPSPGGVNGDILVLEPGGNVGIGTSTPNYMLDVKGSFRSTGETILVGGNVGIGTNAPSYNLDVNGNFRATGGTIALNTTPDNSSGNIGVGQSAYANVKFTVDSSQSFGIFVDDTASGATAGYFHGNVGITGSLSKGSGTFKIDHPLDPEHQWLYHSFVESPDMMNVYNGNIVTDANGDATVALPSYFEALNKDFRYQLTVLGQFAQAMISSEISSNSAGINFGIKTDKPNVKVSWQVTGVRQDAFANAHRVIPEVPKAGDEIGKYIHPLEHGQPESMRMNLLKPQDKK